MRPGSDSFQLWDETGNVLGDFPYSGDGDAAVVAIEAATGAAPAIVEHAPGKCSLYPWTTAEWDGDGFIVVIAREGSTLEAGARFRVMARAATVGAVGIQTAAGLRLGDVSSQMQNLYPDAYTESWEGPTGLTEIVRFDVIAGIPDDGAEPYWGGFAAATNGTVDFLSAPVAYYADC